MLQSVPNQTPIEQSSPGDAPHALVKRARLLRLIERPYLAQVTLITAPAGFGKSTLAAHWAERARQAVAWVALVPESNSPARFLADLHAAVERAVAGPDPPSAPEPTIDGIISLLRTAAEAGRGVMLILDDYHLIENRDVHRAMDALVTSLSPNSHLLVLSRTIPPIALGRLRVQGWVRELTEAELRFTRAEVATLFAAEAGGLLRPRQVTRLAERTDGWIAGIRLALLAISRVDAEQIDPLIEAVAGHPWLADYVVEEVLDDLPEEVRDFVLRTAMLGVLSPALCDAVLEIDTSAALIAEVARRLVFVRRDYREGDSVAYHALFAEVVARIAEQHVSTGDRQAQHRRAARWFEQQGRMEAAIDHAVKGEDWELAIRAERELCRSLRDRDLSYSQLHWLAKLPESVILSQADLTAWTIRALLVTGQARDGLRLFRAVEPAWQQSGDPVCEGYALGCQALVAAFDGDIDRSLQLLYRRLSCFPSDQAVDRLHAWSGIYEWEFHRGNDEAADEAYRQAERCRAQLPAGQRFWTLHTEFVRTNNYAMRGDLETAERLYRHALAHLSGQLRDAEARYRYRLAAIYLEWNELDRAEAEATLFAADLELFPWQYWYPEAWLTAAQVHRARGRHEAADKTLRRLLAMSDAHGETHSTHRARALEASWWLEQGELALAQAWADGVRATDPDWVHVFGENTLSETRIQLRIAEGAYEDALALARARIDEGTRLKRWAELVPLHVWEVVAQLGLGDEAAALDALRAVLALGMPGRFVRAFSSPGTDLRPFLRHALPRLAPEEAAHVRRVLAGGDRAPGDAAQRPRRARAEALAEPLTSRECDVLLLLHQGLTNRAIAERLFIGERTVRMHVGNMLAKLGVTNRTAAVIRAGEIGLLDAPDGRNEPAGGLVLLSPARSPSTPRAS